MIRDYLDIDHKWGILAYYDVLPEDFSQLGPILREFGCSESDIAHAQRVVSIPNHAFVYNVPWARMSVMAVGPVTHPRQFLNSFMHESDHLQDAILEYYDVAQGTEQAAYLQGYLGELAYDAILPLLCPENCPEDVEFEYMRLPPVNFRCRCGQ